MADRGIVDVVGRACRLPGAASVGTLWRLLTERRCSVGEIPPDRWRHEVFLNPRRGVPGKSYTFRAGVIDDVWGFDPAPFGLSKREAEQMDPQQRHLLEVTYEAIADAGLKPSALAGLPVGVFIGASNLDSVNRRFFDLASADPYFMTGNTLSLVSNRLSYVFDLKGPSFTIDTACSSAMVALHEAVAALEAGRIETAIVGGVNILLSPFPFIGFSAAQMLSPEGLCRPFDAEGQGYVRSEGCIVLVLQRRDARQAPAPRRHVSIVASGTNCDGRTVGVALPSAAAQAALLEEIYRKAGLDPENLAFVEAHGTGTRAGDPVETKAIGEALGRRRLQPLPIGSIKSNIGHLEPVAGLAGVLKAMLALEHDLYPATLHFKTPNPDIAFGALNLRVAAEPVALQRGGGRRLAGVSSFGFGGTNAHVVITDPVAPATTAERPRIHALAVPTAGEPAAGGGEALLISAWDEAALKALAGSYAALWPSLGSAERRALAAETVHGRDLMPHRLLATAPTAGELAGRLAEYAAAAAPKAVPGVVTDRAVAVAAPTAFVFNGNGAQWAGMGRIALRHSDVFRRSFEAVDAVFAPLAGWSLGEAITAEDIGARLVRTSVAQPLLLAIQIATVDALAELGLKPDVVLGHSVGEVAAAYAAGSLTLEQAVRVIHARSSAQELARGTGRMAAVQLSSADARSALARLGAAGVEIAAVNGPRSVTLAGPAALVEQAVRALKAQGVQATVLDLDYPFHCALMDPAEGPLLAQLAGLLPRDGRLPMISTVTGAAIDGATLDAGYWWRNVREPVRFADGVQAAAGLGARIFLEVGPHAILRSYLTDCLRGVKLECAALPTFTRNDPADRDPVLHAFAGALARGARVDVARLFGVRPLPPPELPAYPFQHQHLAPAWTEEMMDPGLVVPQPRAGEALRRHPLLGVRPLAEVPVWIGHLDVSSVPALADHVVHGRIVLPGAAYVELALAAGRAHTGARQIEVRDFDIVSPMLLDGDTQRQVRVRLAPDTMRVEIASRARLSGDDWQLHAAGRIAPLEPDATAAVDDAAVENGGASIEGAAIYAAAERMGLRYGPAFRRALAVRQVGEGTLDVTLDGAGSAWGKDARLELDPTALDAALHGLLAAGARHGGADAPYVPIRFQSVRLRQPDSVATRARIHIARASERSLLADVLLMEANGAVVAEVLGARFRAVPATGIDIARHSYVYQRQRVRVPTRVPEPPAPRIVAKPLTGDDPAAARDGEARLLVEAAARRIALDVATLLADSEGSFPVDTPGRVAAGQADREAYITSLLALAADARLIETVAGQGWRLVAAAGDGLPPLADLLATIMADHPAWGGEVALLARAADASRELVRGRLPSGRAPYAAATLDQLVSHSPRARRHVDRIARLVAGLLDGWPESRALRILELGAPGSELSRALAPIIARHGGQLVVVGAGTEICDRLRADLEAVDRADVLAEADFIKSSAALPAVDLVVSANGLHTLESPERALAAARDVLVADGEFIATHEVPDGFHTVVLGLVPGWLARTVRPDQPIGRLRASREWKTALSRAGFDGPTVTGGSDAFDDVPVLVARAGSAAGKTAAEPTPDETANVVRLPIGPPVMLGIVGGLGGGRLIEEIERGLAQLARSTRASEAAGAADGPASSDGACDLVRLVRLGRSDDDQQHDIARAMLELKALVTENGARPLRLWLLLPGAARGLAGLAAGDPAMAALWAFARTLQNEVPALEVRLVDWVPGLSNQLLGQRIADLVVHAGPETEMVIDEAGVFGLRAARRDRGRADVSRDDCDRATRLVVSAGGSGLDRLQWTAVSRRAPGPGEVEIEVAATGLNFRDVMWALGLLPEEALEDGFAGPTMGFECSGRIVRLGPEVRGLSVGDPVIAMASSAFASHATVPRIAVARLPSGVDLVAAATIPVAFLTTYYALQHLAAIEDGEWVLIHGAAGGVGLAAIQIARWRGARVIATAGSPEKRALLAELGIEHVLDSRSLAFADDVMRITGGGGVDVVLNSLAGEAMERSLELVRPFGRFLELGKRDYYANTFIGVRPFRRNVSYFGIDADQLLKSKPRLADRLLGELMEHFAAGTFTPLPYRCYPAAQVVEACRLMQQSGHIGKIVVLPPAAGAGAAAGGARFRAAPHGWHVVVGGTGGFGFATAEWLVANGARHVALASRSGKVSEEITPRLEALRADGVEVEVAACDATRREDLEALLARLRARRPISGVVHAAMVLDDALIANLDVPRIERVLAPKIAAARHLDLLTRGDALSYFVLYSSVTVMIGNPGQAAYVAGNAYIEELARARRRAGRPALAVAWGAISDVGVLARQGDKAKAIALRTGGAALTSRSALDALGALLAEGGVGNDDAAVTIAPMSWSTATRSLKSLAGPTYALLHKLAAAEGAGVAADTDLVSAIEGLDDKEALALITAALTSEIARILRLPAEGLNPQRPLVDFGMDSLMSAELLFAARERLGLEIPAMSIAEQVTIADIAARALTRIRGKGTSMSPIAAEVELARQHIQVPDDLDEATKQAIAERIQGARGEIHTRSGSAT